MNENNSGALNINIRLKDEFYKKFHNLLKTDLNLQADTQVVDSVWTDRKIHG